MKAFLASVLPLLAATDVRGCSFTPPTSTPPNASDYLNPNFFGYHYETASWVNWALGGSILHLADVEVAEILGYQTTRAKSTSSPGICTRLQRIGLAVYPSSVWEELIRK